MKLTLANSKLGSMENFFFLYLSCSQFRDTLHKASPSPNRIELWLLRGLAKPIMHLCMGFPASFPSPAFLLSGITFPVKLLDIPSLCLRLCLQGIQAQTESYFSICCTSRLCSKWNLATRAHFLSKPWLLFLKISFQYFTASVDSNDVNVESIF